LIIEILSLEDGILPFANGKYLKEAFAEILQYFSSYTMSNVVGGSLKDFAYHVSKGDVCRFRICFLNEEKIKEFYENLIHIKLYDSIEICGINFELQNIRIERSEDLSNIIRENNYRRSYFKLHFTSPTYFKAEDKVYLIPEPKMIFSGYANNWNRLMSKEYQISQDDLNKIVESCNLVMSNLELFSFYREEEKITGFTGICGYRIKDCIDFDSLIKLNWLLRLSNYCGTGEDTKEGMGQTYFGM